jgi:hypothetical protein
VELGTAAPLLKFLRMPIPSCLLALALSAAVAAPDRPADDVKAGEAKKPEDRPAHESPYSAFGAPHAKKTQKKKNTGPRVHCKDGSIQTQGQRKDKGVCEGHGGVK